MPSALRPRLVQLSTLQGLSFYFLNRGRSSIYHMSRNPDTGRLVYGNSYTNPRWGDPRGVAISPDGRFVFMMDGRERSYELIWQLDRNTTTGGLAAPRQIPTEHLQVHDGIPLAGRADFSFAGDGSVLYQLMQFNGCAAGTMVLGSFNFDASAGALDLEPRPSDCPLLATHTAFASSSDGAHVYVVVQHGLAATQFSGAAGEGPNRDYFKNNHFSIVQMSKYNLTARPTAARSV